VVISSVSTPATAFLHAVADLALLVRQMVQMKVKISALLVLTGKAESRADIVPAEFSFSTPSAPPSTYTFKLISGLPRCGTISLVL
jgi:hypothetical protein